MTKKYTVIEGWNKPENIEGVGGISTETGLITGGPKDIDGGTSI